MSGMRNVGRLIRGDFRRLGGSVVTLVTVIGLVVLPSIFSWYNILACWDVFGNTGNLTVAVANADEGHQSDLVPLKVNIGDQVISALRANDQLDWVFTDEEDAIDGARGGRYYAAVVIPPSFSRDMMSFYTDDVEHAKITYYSNQKKSAIAPKVTDQGADQVSAQVNKVFAETVSEVALGISSALLAAADDSSLDGQIAGVAQHAQRLATQLDDMGATLGAYSAVLGAASSLVEDSARLLEQAHGAADEAASTAQGAKEALRGAQRALQASSAALASAVHGLSGDYDDLAQAIGESYAASHEAAQEAIGLLEERAAQAEELGLHELSALLTRAATTVRDADDATQASHASARARAQAARDELDGARADYDAEMKPAIDKLASTLTQAEAAIAQIDSALDGASDALEGRAGALGGQIGDAKDKVDRTAGELALAAATTRRLAQDLGEALTNADADKLREIIGTDPDVLAAELAAPVKLERTALFPVENFGSAMSPLYTTLALWIGALLLMVTLKVHPSARTLAELDAPTPRQVFLGRFCTIAVLSLAQSTLLAVGNLVFLEVQAVHPWLYLLCFWTSGLVFAFIVYTLVFLFANLGKALSVVLLIVQVAGGGGSFPLQLLPALFQSMSPFLPIAHAVRAMRAAMFGTWMGDFWVELGILALFTVPMAILGLVLHKPLGVIVPRFIERVEKSKLM